MFSQVSYNSLQKGQIISVEQHKPRCEKERFMNDFMMPHNEGKQTCKLNSEGENSHLKRKIPKAYKKFRTLPTVCTSKHYFRLSKRKTKLPLINSLKPRKLLKTVLLSPKLITPKVKTDVNE